MNVSLEGVGERGELVFEREAMRRASSASDLYTTFAFDKDSHRFPGTSD
jgi:hypothetical protein